MPVLLAPSLLLTRRLKTCTLALRVISGVVGYLRFSGPRFAGLQEHCVGVQQERRESHMTKTVETRPRPPRKATFRIFSSSALVQATSHEVFSGAVTQKVLSQGSPQCCSGGTHPQQQTQQLAGSFIASHDLKSLT